MKSVTSKKAHQDICNSLELFAKEVMPEFHALDPAHQERKQSILNGELLLVDIDTDDFNFRICAMERTQAKVS